MLLVVLSLAACGNGDSTFTVEPASNAPANNVPANDGLSPPPIQEREVDVNDGSSEETQEEEPQETGLPEPAESVENAENDQAPDPQPVPVAESSTVFTPAVSDISDNLFLYQQNGYEQPDVIRIDLKTNTIAGVCSEEDLSGCTLADVLNDTDSRDKFRVDIPVHFSATDFAHDGSMNNAELRQRGGGARYAAQKSFRIKLDNQNLLWRDERHLQLNKHPFENSRIRNKLSFDLMIDIPHLPSFRTQFVNLWIDDGLGPVDYGFYTHVERADERYLTSRNHSDDDRLYKAEFFRFRESDRDTLLIGEDGEPLDKDTFESVLEIESGKNHINLVNMLDALHSTAQPFEAVFDRYFNANNVLTWVAVNLLLGQQDATRHNYFLYNPEESEKFYFIPWDYDFTFQKHIEPENNFTPDALRQRLGYGYARGSNNEFVENYYRLPGAHDRIIAAATELREHYLSDTRIAEHAARLASVSFPFVSAEPDITHNPHFSERSSTELEAKVAFNYDAMVNNFSIPLPPTIEQLELVNGMWKISWKPALELTGHALTYDLQIATGPTFLPDEIEFQAAGIENSDDLVQYSFDPTVLSASNSHYVRLIARSVNQPERYWQIADNYLDIANIRHYGVVELAQKL